jgi:hypothetical protein
MCAGVTVLVCGGCRSVWTPPAAGKAVNKLGLKQAEMRSQQLLPPVTERDSPENGLAGLLSNLADGKQYLQMLMTNAKQVFWAGNPACKSGHS